MPANRLIHEKSPYLLQHAHNPVDWHAWREETFAKAGEQNKPIFLSIGYATCHWCHVMERESFEDEEVAARLNADFICIKVDREERPDVDSVYMAACQMLTGSGGWPLNIFMTPDKRPFFAATYIPKTSRFGRIGLIQLCERIRSLWHDQPGKITESAQSVETALQRAFEFNPDSGPGIALLDRASAQMAKGYDAVNGGFAPAPKFPTPHRLSFLMRCYDRTKDPGTLQMVTRTLDAMRLGGIWDHVGHGFHRYSTDAAWLLPHFEKMLYDQAMMALAYLEAHQLTGARNYAATAEEIFDYVLRDMTAESGAFYSAEDADSEGEEGRFYVWTTDEFRDMLGAEEADFWACIFNLRPEGNYVDEAGGRPTGANILHLTRPLHEWAGALGLRAEELAARWQKLRQQLLQRRSKRVRPLCDDKVLTDWNGLMIAALAAGGRALQRPALTRAAEKAAAFILTRMRDSKGRLNHRFRDGELAVAALAADYAYLIFGLLGLYQTTLDLNYAEEARRLQQEMIARFWDARKGGFFLTAEDSADLPIRPKEIYDGAIPSANSVALTNLLTLARLTGDPGFDTRARDLLRAFAGTVRAQPTGFSFFLTALDFALRPGQEVVIAGAAGTADASRLIATLHQRFAPNSVVMLKDENNAGRLARFAGFTDGLELIRGRTTAHLCKGLACQEATSDIPGLIEMLRQTTASTP